MRVKTLILLLFTKTILACNPPTELTIHADDTGSSITLRWLAADCPFYRVWYSDTPAGSPTLLAVISDISHVATVNESKRFFYVTAVDADSNESSASNVVGFVRIVCPANPAPGIQTVSIPFGLPFKFWWTPSSGVPQYDMETAWPSDIIGDQMNCTSSPLSADRILRVDNGRTAYRLTSQSCSYTGTLQTDLIWNNRMIPGRTYYYQNRTESIRYLVLAGQVDTSGVYAPSPDSTLIIAHAFNEYSWRESRVRSISQLNLFSSGFGCQPGDLFSDRLVAQDGTGNSFWIRCSDGTWQGFLSQIEPGKAYWIQNRHANSWWYDYDASGNP